MKNKIYILKSSFIFILALGLFSGVQASTSLMTTFNDKYPDSSLVNNCTVCHISSDDYGLNSYESDWENAGRDFESIESIDSDSDGWDNITEINAGTYPGDSLSIPSLPIADAGNDQAVNEGDSVILDGSASGDADGNALTFNWSFISKPDTSVAILSDTEAVNPTFVADVAGLYTVQLIVNNGIADSEADSVVISASAGNTPPVANAGDDQAVEEGDVIKLDGSASIDADGNALTFSWSFISKPETSSATISDPAAVKPTFVADVAGMYTVQLIVNDGTTDSDADNVVISASAGNTPPVANAGDDQAVNEGDVIALDGSASSDADGNALTFSWSFISKPETSSAILSDPEAVNPTFEADVSGTYTVQLIVNDGTANSEADSVIILVGSGNTLPVANAGKDQSVGEGETVVLDGSGSVDADGNTLTFSWSFISKPDTSLAELSDPTAINPTFVADVAGTYTIQLIVNDGTSDSEADSVVISTSSTVGVDLDINKFKVSRRVNGHHWNHKEKPVHIFLCVKNSGMVDEQRPATVVGMQNDEMIYEETIMVSNQPGSCYTKFEFPTYVPGGKGKIIWTATIEDDDPDEDVAKAYTHVREDHCKWKRHDKHNHE